jgi:hypothetical protein
MNYDELPPDPPEINNHRNECTDVEGNIGR